MSDIRDSILRAIGDEYARRIIILTIKTPMSVQEISMETGIPIATAYRKIKELVDAKLIVKEKSRFTKRGKWVDLYRSAVRSIVVHMNDKGVFVKVRYNEDIVGRLVTLWSDLRGAR